jgi:hypothetical protein
LAVSLTYDIARSFVDDLYTTDNDDEYCDEAYDVGIGVTFRDGIHEASPDVTHVVVEIFVN